MHSLARPLRVPLRTFSSSPSLVANLSPSEEYPGTNPDLLHTLPKDPQLYTNLLVSCSKDATLSHPHQPFEETPQRNQAFRKSKTIHARVERLGFRFSGKLGNALVDVYAKSGDLGYAQRVFDRLEDPSGQAAWNSIMSAYSRQGMPEVVVETFASMWRCGARPDQFGLAIQLSACARLIALEHGKMVHCDVIKMGFETSQFCQGSLIDMYAKCNYVGDALLVFQGVDSPDKISWTNMIAGYARIGMFDEAIELFLRMQKAGSLPDQVTYVTVISACLSLGRLEDAQGLFAQMLSPNAVAWNSIISGHAQSGNEAEALCFYLEMRGRGVKPTRSTLGSVLSAAANLMALHAGRQIHSEAMRLGLDSNVFVGSSLINMYAKSCAIDDARKVFNTLNEKNTVIWNAMFGGYLQNREPEEVIDLFFEMMEFGFQPDEYSFVSLFGVCALLENINLGRQLHSVITKGNFDSNLFVGNAVVDMYTKCGELHDAKQHFALIPSRDAVSWNAIIVGSVHNGDDYEAFNFFQKMRLNLVELDEVSFASIFSACSNLQAFREGRQIHCLSIKHNLDRSLHAGNSLVDLYAKLGEMEDAEKVFLQMPERTVVSWNALISGYVQNNNQMDALNLFRHMQREGLEPSEVTFASVLPACFGTSGLRLGRQMHCRLLKSGLLQNDAYLGVSLLGMYVKCKILEDARKFFSELPESKNLVLWTAIISGHAHNGYNEEALLLFHKLRCYIIRLDEAIFVSVLGACADLAAIRDGKFVHSLIIQTGFGSSEKASSALIDMYAKCGDVRASKQVFDELDSKQDLISWNSILVGFAQNGCAMEALMLFQQMQQLHIKPDEITFLGVLTACSHAGLVSVGRGLFNYMLKKYGVSPRVDHYACMIDLLGRGGYLEDAEEFISNIKVEPDSVIWATFLAACRMHRDHIRGKHVAEKLMELEPHDSSPYIMLSSIYAESGDWDEAKVVRRSMAERGVKKSPGYSWIVVGDKTNLFVAGDKMHPDAVDINATLKYLQALMKEDGYIAKPDFVLMDEE